MRCGSDARLGLAHELSALDVGFEHEVDEGFFAARRLLFDPPDMRVLGQRDAAAFRKKLAGDQPEQRRLARPVAPDEPDMRARRQRDGRLVDDQPLADAVGEVVDMQHGGLLP